MSSTDLIGIHYHLDGPVLERVDARDDLRIQCPYRMMVSYSWPAASPYHRVQWFATIEAAMRAIARHRRKARDLSLVQLRDSLFDGPRAAPS